MLFRTVTYIQRSSSRALRSLLSTSSRMETLVQQQEQAEQTVTFLKQQLLILTELAAKRQRIAEEEEIKKLRPENENLRNEMLKLKQDLKFYEVQNGAKQIPLPVHNTSAPKTITTAPLQVIEIKEEKPKAQKLQVIEIKGEKPKAQKEQEKKQKDPKKKDSKESGGKGKAASANAVPISPARLNFKVGKIVNVQKHPDADTLFVEEVDVGEEKHRTIVSGLVKSYTIEQMQGRLAIFMCNLKPAKMRGILSEGMIMCASAPEQVEILNVPAGAVPGDRVVCEGYTGEPDAQLSPKKKVWEQIKTGLRVDSNGVPGYKGGAFTIVGKGICTAKYVKDCPIT